MESALAAIGSPAGVAGLAAAALWAPATGCPTWPASSRPRMTSTLVVSLAIGWTVFLLMRRLGAVLGG
ncbi:MAG TPA: hypothetical protein VME40_04815 [Caulobacteraceae bacterium]|nr:hypothetical protein [Caulobacteraceae bacterium]